MTLTTYRSPALSTPTPLSQPQKLIIELALDLTIDMYLSFAFNVKSCKVNVTTCDYVMQSS